MPNIKKTSRFLTHIAMKPEEMERLRAFGASLGAPMSPRQVVLFLLSRAERKAREPARSHTV